MAPADRPGDDDLPATVVRRAPYADNPTVGVRGQQTQQRILDAALEAFGDLGYHRCGVADITDRAGCSRPAFYQYFASKEAVFQALTGQVARQLTASIEALGPVTADADGRRALRELLDRQADIHQRYEPVFHAFDAAARTDAAVASGAARWLGWSLARLRARVDEPSAPARLVEPLLALLWDTINGAQSTASILGAEAPSSDDPSRLPDALADVVHRSLFGIVDGVNVRHDAAHRPTSLPAGPGPRALVEPDRASERTAAGRRTLDRLVAAGQAVLVARGYHDTRVSDVVAAAGMSRAAFYRYFESKDHLARTLAQHAVRQVARSLGSIPVTAGAPRTSGGVDLRRWLERYHETSSDEAAMLEVWLDAAVQDASLRPSAAPALEWGRRHLAEVLRPRGFGDVDADALVMLAVLRAFGSRPLTRPAVDATAHVIERALLGTAA